MKYFTLHELTKSETASRLGISNEPTAEECAALIALADNVLDPARKKYGKPIFVSSGYRCQALNKAVGGAPNSQHVKGEAADIYTDTAECNARLARIIYEQGHFDQLILENANTNGTQCNWVHVSYSRTGNRKQVLIKIKGVKGYKPYQFK